MVRLTRRLEWAVIAAVGLAGCGDEAAPLGSDPRDLGPVTGADAGVGSNPVLADFALEDLNPTSATYQAEVSPRDYLEQVSGWYFTHAS